MITVYGIPNCDTVKKVLTWFKAKKINVEFFNYKENGAPVDKLTAWTQQRDWSEILNKRSTTWKGLDETTQAKLKDAKSAVKLMHEHTSLIKRPVVEKNGKVVAVGFDEKEYQRMFG